MFQFQWLLKLVFYLLKSKFSILISKKYFDDLEYLIQKIQEYFYNLTKMFLWLKSLFHPMVSDGESTNRSYRIPVGIRESDSAIFMPGTIVNFGLRMLIVRHVCISNDLKLLTLSLKDVKEIIPEEIILDASDVTTVLSWNLPSDVNIKSKEMAADSVNELLEEFSSYPKHIKRISRIYILGAKLRKYIHHFLEGLELTTSINLGLVDWDHDPNILGLSEKHPRIIYRIEDKDTHGFLDSFLGPLWDILDLPTMDSFRIILTLELKITSGSDICLTAHSIMCNERPILEEDYRTQYLRFAAEKSVMVVAESMCSKEDDTNKDKRCVDSSGKKWYLRFCPTCSAIMEETFDEENDNIIKTDKKPDGIGDVSTIQNTTFENLEKTLPSEIHDAKHETANDHNERVKIQEQSPAIDSSTEMANSSAIFKSESGSSRAQSRYSTLSHSTAASRPRLQGFFQKGALVANNADNNSAIQCPYPNDWQYGTVPEVITNNDEID